MREFDTLTFHPTTEKIVEILCKKTQNKNPNFFRILLSYYLAKVAASMRVKIATMDRGEIPVNLYAINLASSGQGKGHATNIIEDQLINQFKSIFFDETYPIIVEQNLAKLAVKRAYVQGTDPEEMTLKVTQEFEALGEPAFSFNSGTTPAVKQMRHQLLMAGIGALNLEIDEIGSNLLGNTDVLTTFLELFDVGMIKQKLTKNTKESTRNKEIHGKTPTNLLLFGTPSKLLNGGKTEEEFYSFLETGYARRCLFGYNRYARKKTAKTAEEIFDDLTDTSSNNYIKDMSATFGKLANVMNYDKTITVSKAISILLIEYRMKCESIAESLSEFEEIAKAELSHRYFKALKLAGTYAFIDGQSSISEDNLYAAICMVEESGKAFNQIKNRERNYVKLAKYIAGVNHKVTHVDLTEDLAFYKGSAQVKQEMVQQAITWGYKNHVIIKRSMIDGIEFLKGETLKKTDLTKMIVAYSHDISDGYKNDFAPFDDLHKLTQLPHHHWVNHHTSTGHRSDDVMLPGFNMIVLDIDNGTAIQTIQTLFKDYKFLLYTTKRHAQGGHRFRVVMPLNYQLALSKEDFKEFMLNIYEWLPIQIVTDTQTGQRSRKWLTCKGTYLYNQGDNLLDALLFIPKTHKNDERKKVIQSYESLSNMERWFVLNSGSGGRNNQLIRYALLLVDSGFAVDAIRDRVLELNGKLPDKLSKKEIDSTIMVTVAKASISKSAA